MPHIRYLLIGGGLAASQAAKQLRRQGAKGNLVLVSEEPHVPYDRPPLSKEFLRGETSRDELTYVQPEELEAQGVELVLGCPAVELDPEAHEAVLADGRRIRFEQALLATGGRPRVLGIPGERLAGVHYLRTVDDAQALSVYGEADDVVIVGAGFIGLEAAASLRTRGVKVTVVESAPRVWARFVDETLSDFFQEYCRNRGVMFHMNDTLVEIRGSNAVERVVTREGLEIECDAVLIAIGIEPNVELAQSAGLGVGDGVLVDSHLRTSQPHVLAAGDIANFPDPVFAKRRRVEHWGHAEYSGQIAGQNMAGGDREYELLSYVWSDVFDLHLEFAGDESDYDRSIVRGSVESGAFTVLLLKDDRLTAYFSVNGNKREFSPLKKLIKRHVALAAAAPQLADPGFELRGLM